MSTAAFAGRGGYVTWAGTSMVEVRNWKATYNVDTADVTALSSSGYRHRISTIKDLTGTIESNVFLTAFNTSIGSPRTLVLYTSSEVSTSQPKITCRGILKMSVDVPVDAVNFTYDFESTGTVTIGTT